MLARIIQRIVASLAASSLMLGAASAFSVDDLESTLVQQDYAAARVVVSALTDNDQRDFYAVYIRAHEHLAEDNCAEAVPLLEALAVSQPSFLPAHQLLYLCDLAANNTQLASLRLEVMLAVLPEGPARDQVLTLRRNLALASGPIFSVFGEVVPSSNVTRQTSAAGLNGWVIPEANRATQGTRIRGGAGVTIGLLSSGAWATNASISGELEYNTATKQIAPRLSFEVPTTIQRNDVVFGFGPRLSLRFEEGKLVESQLGAKVFASWQINPRNNARIDGHVYRSTHILDSHLDASHLTSTIAYAYALTPELTVTSHIRGTIDLYDQENLRRNTLEGGLKLDYAASNGLLLGSGITIGNRWHNRPPPMSIGNKQTDQFAVLSAEIGHTAIRIGSITPLLEYTYTKQWSDNIFYQYDSHDVGIRIRANL